MQFTQVLNLCSFRSRPWNTSQIWIPCLPNKTFLGKPAHF